MREVLVTIPDISWHDVGGLHSVKEKLREIIEMPLKKPEVFQQMNMTPGKWNPSLRASGNREDAVGQGCS